jgi:hypothetical protein
MPKDTRNCFERVYCATGGLCGDGPLWRRLSAAMATLSPLQEHEFPTEPLRRLFRLINPNRPIEELPGSSHKEIAGYILNLLVGVAHLDPHTPETGAESSAFNV